mmetsp:Transcript_45199/g.92260  ORF Transcript_45199/g.92260 Transcript_45199/m.92260 type:complete len:208 (+) Transcript_45199:405-1028(+)
MRSVVHLLIEDDAQDILVLAHPQYEKHVPAALVGGAGGDAGALPEVLDLVLACLLPAFDGVVELAAEGFILLAEVVGVHLLALLRWREGAAAGEVGVVGEEVGGLPLVVVELRGCQSPELLVCEDVGLHGSTVGLRLHGEEGRPQLGVDEKVHQPHAVVSLPIDTSLLLRAPWGIHHPTWSLHHASGSLSARGGSCRRGGEDRCGWS